MPKTNYPKLNHKVTRHENNLRAFIWPLLKINFLTPREFCEQVGISRRILDYYFKDQRRPSLAVIMKMADVLRVSPKELIEQVNVRFKKCRAHPEYNL